MFVDIGESISEPRRICPMKKSIAVLWIYDALTSNERLNIEQLMEACDCSRRTCLRYIKDLRDYLKKYRKKNLIFERKKNSFTIVDI